MFNSQFGLLNQWLAKYNIGPVKWLGSDGMAFLCCTTVNLWLALPFMITIMDGALQSIEKAFTKVLFWTEQPGYKNVVYYDSDDQANHCTIGRNYNIYHL